MNLPSAVTLPIVQKQNFGPMALGLSYLKNLGIFGPH